MAANLELNSHEARVLGVLIEKELSTPDQYPLSLNSATAGANQRHNRDPVVSYLEAEVHVALQGLLAKQLAGRVMPAGSRVEKFRHNARESLQVSEPELAVVAELLLRGPQMPGELRGRASRMVAMPTLDELSRTLDSLIGRGLVRRFPPAPGSRAERFGLTVCLLPETLAGANAPNTALGAPAGIPAGTASPASRSSSATGIRPSERIAAGDRIEALEREISHLRRQMKFLAEQAGVDLPEDREGP